MSEKLTVGSLFAGIGGIELGLERTGGFETVWQVEKDEYCRRVLKKHWPSVGRYEDVREVGVDDLGNVDLICGGFPCQDISGAKSTGGEREGVDGEKSGLWSEMYRIVGEIRPQYIFVENVDRIRSDGLGTVLGDLSEVGYDAEWHRIPAGALGAPHRRARVWVVGYTDSRTEPVVPLDDEASELPQFRESVRGWTDTPEGVRVADGIPNRVDRCRALGNAVVPQVAEFIGEQILKVENG